MKFDDKEGYEGSYTSKKFSGVKAKSTGPEPLHLQLQCRWKLDFTRPLKNTLVGIFYRRARDAFSWT